MICRNVHRFATVRRLGLVALLAVGWMASTTLPVFAGTSGTWANTGSLNTARTDHSATLLPNGQVLVAGGLDASSTPTRQRRAVQSGYRHMERHRQHGRGPPRPYGDAAPEW